ncbi:hypothetical protein [Streptomyces sp. 8N706]|uniref:hypothetical protein n=1 Tax=Streptomyces sp. 8N706 TaxID=3457416 RepID=UPI003FD3AAC0
MLSSNAELVWQGRIHLGDEPGIYGDASYSGLGVELPLTVERIGTTGPESTTLTLETRDLKTFQGYPGHLVEVFLFTSGAADPNHWTRTTLATQRLSGDSNTWDIPVSFTGHPSPHRLSVRVSIDTEAPAGLYDDFVLTRLSNRSPGFTYVASLGFSG